MSTKIYNAWEWNDTFDELIRLFNSIRHNEYIQDCLNLVRKIDVSERDRYSHERRIYKYLLEAKNNDQKDFFDVDLSAIVIQHENKIVVCFFGLNEFTFPMMYAKINSKFKYFGWWDNSDLEEGVSEEEWEYRGKWYESVFEKYQSEIFSELGLTYEFFSKSILFKVCDQVAQEKFPRSKNEIL